MSTDDKRISLEKPPHPDQKAPARTHKRRPSGGGGSRWDWTDAVVATVGDVLEAVFIRWWAD